MIDLRLVPAALAAWGAAWLLTGRVVAPHGVIVVAVGAGVVAAVAVACSTRASFAAHALLVWGTVAGIALSVQLHAAGRAPVEALAVQRADATLAGRVVSDARPAPFGSGQTWVLDVDTLDARSAASAVSARVEVTTTAPAPAYGSRVVVRAALSPARPAAAHAARARAEQAEPVRPPHVVVAATTAMRTALLDVTAGLSPQARGLVPGIAVGDTSRLPDDLADAFRTTGLTHLTAVSGGHFAIVLTVVMALAGAVRAPRVVRVGLVAVVAAAFVLLVRPDPSVQRAAAMAAVMLLGVLWRRPAASVPSLAAGVVVLLTLDPWLARSFGFVLSCVATAGLVLLAPPLVRRLTPWVGKAAAFAFAVPVAAQAACGPVLVLLTPALPTTSVLANLLATPAVVPATLLGLAATVLAPWLPGVAHVLAWLAGWATGWIAGVARWCAGIPGAAVPWPGGLVGAAALALVSAAVLVLVLRRAPGSGPPHGWSDLPRRRWRRMRAAGRATVARCRRGVPSRHDRRIAVGVLVAFVAVVVVAASAVRQMVPRTGDVPADWQVVACDVGQGDALVVRSGPTSAVVVDVGPDGEAAGRCLDRLGVTRIDVLVLSHFHADHVGGIAGALTGRTVSRALVSALAEPAGQADRTLDALERSGAAVRSPEPGDSGTLGEQGWHVTWRVLGAADGGPGSARAAGSDEGDGVNDASLAVQLVAVSPGGTLEVVALGDLEEPGQDALRDALRSGGPADVLDGVDVVKIAHHGSASQSVGLARLLRPRVALVSVGEGNTYGHPTRRMLDLYASVGSRVVRTDECGTAVLVVRRATTALACT